MNRLKKCLDEHNPSISHLRLIFFLVGKLIIGTEIYLILVPKLNWTSAVKLYNN